MPNKIPSKSVAQAAQLPKSVKTFAEVHQRAVEASYAYQAAVAARLTAADTRKALENELREAVRGENYARAAVLKKARDEADALVSRQRLAQLATELRAAVDEAGELFFQMNAHYVAPATVSVHRVLVVDPIKGVCDEAVYLDSDTTIQLTVGPKHFESEAYHVGEWALEHGFLVKVSSGEVQL
jgi:hypothetical protein